MLFLSAFGYEVNFLKVFSILSITVAIGVAVGVAIGVAIGEAFGVAIGGAFGAVFGVGGVAIGVAADVVFGVAVGVIGGVTGGVARGVARGVAFGVTVGVFVGVGFGVAGGVAALIGHLRLWALPATAIRQMLANINARWMRPPILDYDLLFFPIPFLKSGTLRLAQKDPQLAQDVLEACTRSPGCVAIATHIREQLQANELASPASQGQ